MPGKRRDPFSRILNNQGEREKEEGLGLEADIVGVLVGIEDGKSSPVVEPSSGSSGGEGSVVVSVDVPPVAEPPAGKAVEVSGKVSVETVEEAVAEPRNVAGKAVEAVSTKLPEEKSKARASMKGAARKPSRAVLGEEKASSMVYVKPSFLARLAVYRSLYNARNGSSLSMGEIVMQLVDKYFKRNFLSGDGMIVTDRDD